MKKIAITGGIGSGKSTICEVLENLGYTVFYSDNEAINLTEQNPELKTALIQEFGNETYLDGKYNRKFISKIVFNDKNKLEKLNEIFKKFIDERFDEFCMNSYDEIVFYESALIFEHNKQDMFDYIITVYCDEAEIRRRLKIRNGYSDEEIGERLKNQLDPEIKKQKSDFIINTNCFKVECLLEIIQKIK